MKTSAFLACIVILAAVPMEAAAFSQPGCTATNYSAADISSAIGKSPDTNQALKAGSCTFGGTGVAESGGNTCASNGNNFGVLQLTKSNLPAGMTPDAYLNLPLQQQVDIWAQQVGNTNTGAGYQTLQTAASAGQTIGGTPVTQGMSGACFQFGPAICKNDVAFMQQNGGACPTVANGGRNINAVGGATANLDGNNQSICSWGNDIQGKIDKASASCAKTPEGPAQCELGPGGFDPGTPNVAAATAPQNATITLANDITPPGA